jgi:hypothetical protein
VTSFFIATVPDCAPQPNYFQAHWIESVIEDVLRIKPQVVVEPRDKSSFHAEEELSR